MKRIVCIYWEQAFSWSTYRAASSFKVLAWRMRFPGSKIDQDWNCNRWFFFIHCDYSVSHQHFPPEKDGAKLNVLTRETSKVLQSETCCSCSVDVRLVHQFDSLERVGFFSHHMMYWHMLVTSCAVLKWSFLLLQGGVTFFSDSLNSYHDDDPLLEAMPGLPQEPAVCRWMAEEVKKFRTIHTPKAIMLAKLLYVRKCMEKSCVLKLIILGKLEELYVNNYH